MDSLPEDDLDALLQQPVNARVQKTLSRLKKRLLPEASKPQEPQQPDAGLSPQPEGDDPSEPPPAGSGSPTASASAGMYLHLL